MFWRKLINYNAFSDEELMRMLAKGKREALEELYQRYFKKLIWFAKGFLNDDQFAEDLVQDIFIKIIEKPTQFNPDKKFSTWVYTVTANLCRQNIRNVKNRERILEEENHIRESKTDTEFIDVKLLKERVAEVFEQLSEKDKNIYNLRFVEELPIKEIAEILQIPEGSVKSGIYYLLKKFSYHLKDFSYEN